MTEKFKEPYAEGTSTCFGAVSLHSNGVRDFAHKTTVDSRYLEVEGTR